MIAEIVLVVLVAAGVVVRVELLRRDPVKPYVRPALAWCWVHAGGSALTRFALRGAHHWSRLMWATDAWRVGLPHREDYRGHHRWAAICGEEESA